MKIHGRSSTSVLVLVLVLAGLGIRVWYAAEALRVDRFVDEKYSLMNVRALVVEGTLEPASSYYPYPLFNIPPAPWWLAVRHSSVAWAIQYLKR